MRPYRATLREVARQAGVSPATASFVTTGREDMRISEAARQRVLRAAHELNYRPNLMARSLRTKVTRTIALLSDTIATEQYAGAVIYGSLAAALEHGHLLFIGETEGDPRVEANLIEELLSRQVDGFVYASTYTRPARIPRVLRGQPLVLLNCTSPDRKTPAILPDELGGGRMAAQALLDAGHRTGIYVVGEQAPHTIPGRERLAGIEEALGAAGSGIVGTIACEWWPEPAHDAVADFLRRGERPCALICMNDRIAFGSYQALQEAGVGIPDDVSVVSFDDSDLASWLRPQLTSIALPHFEMGRRAIETLLTDHPQPEISRVPMPLRERASLAPPPSRRSSRG